jgi:hypothetical protein
MSPKFDPYYFDEVAPDHKAKASREFYGLVDARRDLQLKTEDKQQ